MPSRLRVIPDAILSYLLTSVASFFIDAIQLSTLYQEVGNRPEMILNVPPFYRRTATGITVDGKVFSYSRVPGPQQQQDNQYQDTGIGTGLNFVSFLGD